MTVFCYANTVPYCAAGPVSMGKVQLQNFSLYTYRGENQLSGRLLTIRRASFPTIQHPLLPLVRTDSRGVPELLFLGLAGTRILGTGAV
jgi:hypothetical protein